MCSRLAFVCHSKYLLVDLLFGHSGPRYILWHQTLVESIRELIHSRKQDLADLVMKTSWYIGSLPSGNGSRLRTSDGGNLSRNMADTRQYCLCLWYRRPMGG